MHNCMCSAKRQRRVTLSGRHGCCDNDDNLTLVKVAKEVACSNCCFRFSSFSCCCCEFS